MLSLCSLGQEPGRGHASAGAPIPAAVPVQPSSTELENQPPVAVALAPQHLELELASGLLGKRGGSWGCISAVAGAIPVSWFPPWPCPSLSSDTETIQTSRSGWPLWW